MEKKKNQPAVLINGSLVRNVTIWVKLHLYIVNEVYAIQVPTARAFKNALQKKMLVSYFLFSQS